ncbi:MAG: hypothetical protein GY951_18260 [Psychromonas sp.]|nr:hypothetical protein [Alteromonadales bacterium]MCP5079975.1 hypothetical protein [Psychromonas sp.]
MIKNIVRSTMLLGSIVLGANTYAASAETCNAFDTYKAGDICQMDNVIYTSDHYKHEALPTNSDGWRVINANSPTKYEQGAPVEFDSDLYGTVNRDPPVKESVCCAEGESYSSWVQIDIASKNSTMALTLMIEEEQYLMPETLVFLDGVMLGKSDDNGNFLVEFGEMHAAQTVLIRAVRPGMVEVQKEYVVEPGKAYDEILYLEESMGSEEHELVGAPQLWNPDTASSFSFVDSFGKRAKITRVVEVQAVSVRTGNFVDLTVFFDVSDNEEIVNTDIFGVSAALAKLEPGTLELIVYGQDEYRLNYVQQVEFFYAPINLAIDLNASVEHPDMDLSTVVLNAEYLVDSLKLSLIPNADGTLDTQTLPVGNWSVSATWTSPEGKVFTSQSQFSLVTPLKLNLYLRSIEEIEQGLKQFTKSPMVKSAKMATKPTNQVFADRAEAIKKS